MKVNILLEIDDVIYREGDTISLKGNLDIPVDIEKAIITKIERNRMEIKVLKGFAMKNQERLNDLEDRELRILIYDIENISHVN